MKYILGLIGHPNLNEDIEKIINKYFDNVTVYKIPIIDSKDINVIITRTSFIKNKCDGLLFTGEDIYQLFFSKTKTSLQSDYLDYKRTEIIKTLFRANISKSNSHCNISIDSISYKEVKSIYDELGINSEGKSQIITIPTDINDNNILENTTSSHISNHEQFDSTCITFFTETRDVLNKLNIPCYRVGINKNELIRKVSRLITKSDIPPTNNTNNIAIVITLSDLKEHVILENTEHNILTEYNKISEIIFWFSEKLNGAYIPNDQRKYIIFCNRDNYETVTEFSSQLEVLNKISTRNFFYCNIGIGYGENVREAIKHATIAQIRSTKERKSTSYVMYSKDKITGPLFPSVYNDKKNNPIYDVKLAEVAENSGININTIYKLHNHIVRTGEGEQTARNISTALGITTRSTNRLLEKLIRSEYIIIAGKKSLGGKGRPQRIFRFIF